MDERGDFFSPPRNKFSLVKAQIQNSEVAVRRCSYEKVFWKYVANLQKNTHAEVRYVNKM